MRIVNFLLFFLLIFLSCSKKQKDRKEMKIQEPDFSEMIRKSDSARRQANKDKVLNKTDSIHKQIPKRNLNEIPIVVEKETVKKVIKKTPKAVIKSTSVHTSGLIYTVQIAALDSEDKKYSTINNVITYNENSLVKYSLGSFKTFKEAQHYRNSIINKYKGAFVKALKNNVPVQLNK